MSSGFRVELQIGARILTSRGIETVTGLQRHGVRVTDSIGQHRDVPYDQLSAIQVTNGGVQALHRSLEPWWSGLDPTTRDATLVKLEAVLEILTGYRRGSPDLALPGEPFHPFGTQYGASLRQRTQAMARQISAERAMDRRIIRRVADGELAAATVTPQAIYLWVRAWEREGLRGLVDGRGTRSVQGFDGLDPRFLRIADEELAVFDGGVSVVGRGELERRILVRLKQEGVTDAHLPQRLVGEYLSSRLDTLGRTARSHRSHAQRGVSSRASYPAQHPGHLVVDVTRADNLVWDEVQERIYSVEIITIISVSTRVVVACRVVPRSASSLEAGLALYDAMRPFAMVVDGTSIDDFRWTGIPQSLDMHPAPPPATHRQRPATTGGVQGIHVKPAVTPTSLRADNGSIFLSASFRSILHELQVDLMPSRGSKPTDNPHLERFHETLQRAYQAIPGFKGRGVYERGRFVMRADQPLLTADQLQSHLHRFVALDYHRTPHRGLKLPGLTTARLTPLEMFDALLEATGRIHVAQHGDLIYQFLPQRWLTPGHSGVEYRGLTYDGPVLDTLRGQRTGTYRAQDDKVPFLYDPRDVTRLWHRSRDDGRIHEVTWKSAHLVHAPLGAVVRDRALSLIKARGGNNAVSARLVKRQIIDEITELTSAKGTEE